MGFQNLSHLYEPEPELETWSISSEKNADFLRSMNPGSRIQEVQVFPTYKKNPIVKFEKSLSKGRREGEVDLGDAAGSLKPGGLSPAQSMQGEYNVRPSGPPPPTREIYEAAVGALFVRSVQESLDERFEAAEVLREAYKIPANVHTEALLRAQNAAEYKLADLEARIEALLNNRGPCYTPASFPSPQLYNIWRDEEVSALKALQSSIKHLPAMVGNLILQLNSSTVKIGGGLFACGTPQSDSEVYISATVTGAKGMGLRWRSKSMDKAKVVSWNQKSVPLTATDPQDELVLELWESKSRQETAGIRRMNNDDDMDAKSPSSRGLVDDKLLGEARISFGEIERLSGRAGGTGVKATTPDIDLVLTAAGKKKRGSVSFRVTWTAERHNRGKPADPMLIALLPNAEAVYDALLRKAWEEKDLRSAGSRWKYEIPPVWEYILTSFAEHHRVRPAHCHLASMDKLTKAFRTDTAYLEVVVDEWREVCRLALNGRLTKDESILQNIMVKALEAPAIEAIQNFDTEFPRNQPPGALAALLQLLGLLMRFDPDPSKLELQLTEWTEIAMQRTFSCIMFGSADPSGKQLTVESVMAFTRACREIQAVLGEHATLYASSFPTNLPLVQLTGTSLYRQFIDHLKVFLASADTKVFTRTYQDLVIALFELHVTLDQLGVVLPNKLDIPAFFDDYVLTWASGTTSRLVDWIQTNVTTERWVPASLSKDRVFFSTSVIDLFCLLEQVVEDINPQLVQQDLGHRFLAAMEGAMCTAVEAYVSLIEKECLKELPHEGDEDGSAPPRGGAGLVEHRPPVCITQSLCVKLNNLSMTRKLQRELELRLAEEWSGVAGKSLPKIPYPKTPYELAQEERNNEPDPDEDGLPYSDSDSEDLGFKEEELEDFATVNKEAGSESRPFVGKHFGELIGFIDRAYLDVMGAIVECIQANMISELQTAVCGKGGALNMEKRLVPLTEYLDEYLAVMNGHLMPHVFRRMLEFLWAAIVNSLEEMTLHSDDELPLLTRHQKDLLEQGLDVLNDYFHADGQGLPLETMQSSTKRLRRLLTLFNVSTRELAGLYWRAWDRRQRSTATIKGPVGDPSEAGSGAAEEKQVEEQEAGPEPTFGHEHREGEELLSVLDYMYLLKERVHDQEATELVMMQEQAAGSYTVQQVFGLPEGEVLVASFRCHNSRKHKGALYICQHFVAFKTLLTHTGDSHSKLVLPLEKVARLDKHRAGGIYIGQFNRQPVKFGGLKKERDAAFETIVQRVIGSGWYLERYLAGHIKTRTGIQVKEIELRRYKASRWSRIQNKAGELICYGTYLCFARPNKDKLKQVRYDDIKDIRVGHLGLTHGVKIETRAGKQYLFTKFADVPEPTVVSELRRLAFNEAPGSAAPPVRPKPKLLTFSQRAISNGSEEKKALEDAPRGDSPGGKEAAPPGTGPADSDDVFGTPKQGGMRKLLSRKSSGEGEGSPVTSAVTSAGASAEGAESAHGKGSSRLRSFAKSMSGKVGKASPSKGHVALSETFLRSEEPLTPGGGAPVSPAAEAAGQVTSATGGSTPGGKTGSSRFAAARGLARGFSGKGLKAGSVEADKSLPAVLPAASAPTAEAAVLSTPGQAQEKQPVGNVPGREVANGEPSTPVDVSPSLEKQSSPLSSN